MRTDGGRRESLGLVGLGLLALVTTGGIDRKAAQLNNQANGLYAAKKYDEATQVYGDAASRAPDAAAIYYNQGNALFRQGKLEDAAKLLQRGAESGDAAIRQRSLYNLGNALYGTKKLPEAVAAYRQALVLDPRDRDAKINFEKALRELQQQQQQQQQSQQGQQGKQSKDGKQDQQDKQGQQGKQQDQQGQQQQAKDQESKEKQDQQAQSQPEDEKQPPPQAARLDSVPAGELSREEALRILEAMRQQEKELQAEKARMRVRTRRVDKDW